MTGTRKRWPTDKDIESTEQASLSQRCADAANTEENDTDYGESYGETQGGREMVSDEHIYKELVMWAGRLELESIDLRDKSRGLIAELVQNNGTLRRTSSDLKSLIDDWKKLAGDLNQNKGLTRKSDIFDYTDVKSLLEKINESVNALPGGTNGVITLNTIKVTNRKLTSFADRFEKQITTIVKQAVNETVNDHLGVAHERNRNSTSKTIDDKLDTFMRRLDDLYNSHIDVTREMSALKRSQNDLIKEIRDMKNTAVSIGGTSNILLTPNTSLGSQLDCHSSQVIPRRATLSQSVTQERSAHSKGTRGYEARRLQSRTLMKAKSPSSMIKSRRRQILPQLKPLEEDSCISLLSDDATDI
jgi:hypothetical protein